METIIDLEARNRGINDSNNYFFSNFFLQIASEYSILIKMENLEIEHLECLIFLLFAIFNQSSELHACIISQCNRLYSAVENLELHSLI